MRRPDIGILTLSGFNHRSVVALCRFGRTANLPIHLIARDDVDPIYLTDYASQVLCRREDPRLTPGEVAAWIRRLREEHGYRQVLLAPSTEFFNRFALSHRRELEAAGGVLPLVDAGLYAAISDKLSFSAMCSRHGIVVPEELEGLPDRFPFVAKPIRYASSDGRQLKPHLVMSPSDRARFETTERISDFYFQPYVAGRSFYLLMYVGAEGPALKYSQENLIQQRDGGSIVLARRATFHETAEADAYERMLRSEGFRGLVMIEVRKPGEGEPSVMIEANPRMWGPIQFALDNRIDLFGAMVRDFTGCAPSPCPEPRSPVDGSHYFWSGGMGPQSQPLAFHGYSETEFVRDFTRIGRCDLFGRNDTLALYQAELVN